MKFRATLGDVGARWLDRFAPVFDRLGGEATLLLTPTTVRVVQSARVADGVVRARRLSRRRDVRAVQDLVRVRR